jgi:dynein heavy chain
MIRVDNRSIALEWRFFLTGPLVQVNVPMNPCVWISDSAWPEVYLNVFGLSQIDIFVELVRHVIGNTSDFRGVYF